MNNRKSWLMLILGFVVIIVISCGKDGDSLDVIIPVDTIPSDTISGDSVEICFELVDNTGRRYLPFYMSDNTLHYAVDAKTDLTEITPMPIGKGDTIIINDIKLPFDSCAIDFSDFTRPVIFQSYKSDSSCVKYTVNIYNLPVLLVDTPDALPIESKTQRIEGCSVRLVSSNEDISLGTAGIRGRGNSSWEQPKKPYNLRLNKSNGILGMKKSKHWLLLANAYYDRTQIHNATAFEIARLTDFPWVQSGKFVELILNGEHKGLYYLCEKIEVDNDKIDIKVKDPVNDTDCAYLLESYVVYEEDPLKVDMPSGCFLTNVFNTSGDWRQHVTLAWEIKEPEEFEQKHKDYIFSSLCDVEKLIRDSIDAGTYRSYVDIDTFVDWWLVEELCLNEEASRSKNVYIYKSGINGKFCMGPPWDFDAWSFGLYWTPGEFVPGHYFSKDCAIYFKELFKDSVFVNRVKEKWSRYKPVWEKHIPQFIDENYTLIRESAERNELMWSRWYFPNETYKQTVTEMRDAFMIQLYWMDEQIRNM